MATIVSRGLVYVFRPSYAAVEMDGWVVRYSNLSLSPWQRLHSIRLQSRPALLLSATDSLSLLWRLIPLQVFKPYAESVKCWFQVGPASSNAGSTVIQYFLDAG